MVIFKCSSFFFDISEKIKKLDCIYTDSLLPLIPNIIIRNSFTSSDELFILDKPKKVFDLLNDMGVDSCLYQFLLYIRNSITPVSVSLHIVFGIVFDLHKYFVSNTESIEEYNKSIKSKKEFRLGLVVMISILDKHLDVYKYNKKKKVAIMNKFIYFFDKRIKKYKVDNNFVWNFYLISSEIDTINTIDI